MKRRVTVGIVAAFAIATLPALSPAVSAQAESTTQGPASPKPTPSVAALGDGVAAAVAAGPTSLIVSFDASRTTETVSALTATNQTAKAAHVATVGFAATKRAALSKVSGMVTKTRDYPHLPISIVRVPTSAALAALASAPGVSSINLPKTYSPTEVPAHLSSIHQPEGVAAGATGTATTVAVIDTGLDYTLGGVGDTFGDCTGGPDSVGCRILKVQDVSGSGELDIDAGYHGTNVSGIVADTAPGAMVAAYGVFTAVEGGITAHETDIMQALNNVIADASSLGIRSVNLSLGDGAFHTSECTDATYAQPFLSLRALGIVPVVAAGNSGWKDGAFHVGVSEPACASGAVRVGAVYASDSVDHSWNSGCDDIAPEALDIVCFSQGGPLLSLYAPGLDVEAAGITESGTSQASPHVAAAAAMLASLHPEATAQQIVRALTTTGQSLHDHRFGAKTYSANLLDIGAAAAALDTTGAEIDDPACTTNSLPANDDDSTDLVPLGFGLNFYGTTYSALYVNNNGNVTFNDKQQPITPFTIAADTPPMIAPFFGDVDTNGPGSGLVTYGATTYGSRPALCVNWNDVGYFDSHAEKRNSFQLLLVDRSDSGAGDFDIVMNYNTLNWETGDGSGGVNGFGGTPAGAGFSAEDGDSAHFFQFPGSGTSLGLVDSNPLGLVNSSRGSVVLGRYVFGIRNGSLPQAGSVAGRVSSNLGAAVAGSPVQACPVGGGFCTVGVSGPSGDYAIFGIAAGNYNVTALPPPGSGDLPAHLPVTVGENEDVTGADLVLTGPTPLPDGTTITDHGSEDGVPVVFWQEPLVLNTVGCVGGTAKYTISQGAAEIRSGAMVEATPGHFHATIAAVYPNHGDAAVSIVVDCPGGGPPQTVDFSVYIDPSGTVVDERGRPISGATVTLLRSDTSAGPFDVVPNGSAVMDPSNRVNPFVVGADGIFHWDVLAGYYMLTASKPGCTSLAGAPAVTSAVLPVPPPAIDISLVLNCEHPPTAQPDGTTTLQDTPRTVAAPGVLANDSDPDGDPLTAALATPPVHGTLSLQANGSFTYTPAAGFLGTDSFSYRADDGLQKSSATTVTIAVGARQSTLTKTTLAFEKVGTPTYGTRATIRASVADASTKAALSGVPVTLLARKKGSKATFLPLAAAVSANGKLVFTVKATSSLELQMQVAASSAYELSNSATKLFAVAPSVKTALGKRSATPGSRVAFTGSVLPHRKGVTVQLLHRVGKQWVAIAKTKTNKAGRFAFVLKAGKPGTASYAVRTKAGSGLIATTTAPVKLKVLKP